ncbi:MAG: germination protein YpeB [Clostridia bacterium]|nr:germination protein YpeB [Clostridia bacterium]
MKRANIRVASYFLAALLVAVGFYYRQVKITEKYKENIETSYTKAMYNLSESLSNISSDLKKTILIKTPKTFSSYATKIYCEAEIAKEALSKLPGDHNELKTVNLFLSQVGNFTLSLSKDLISGNELNEEQTENLKMLSRTADIVSNAIEDAKITHNNPDYWGKEIESIVSKKVDTASLASSLTEIEEKLTDYPTLIYDGPYSDHILTKKPTMTTNKPEIEKNNAGRIAQKISGTNNLLTYDETTYGKIECYRFSNESVTISISKDGGYPVFMIKSRNIGNSNIKTDDLKNKAEKFLEDNGFQNMTVTYFESRDGLTTFNFAYLDGQTVCYTDLIKVGVAEDTGEIMSIETVGYLTNHTIRAFDSPKYTLDMAREVISEELTPKSEKIALIPTSGGGEVRCYEFECESEDNQFLIYINTQTLEFEDVFILLVGENGTLVK